MLTWMGDKQNLYPVWGGGQSSTTMLESCFEASQKTSNRANVWSRMYHSMAYIPTHLISYFRDIGQMYSLLFYFKSVGNGLSLDSH